MAEEGVDEEDRSPEPEEFDEGPEEEVRLEAGEGRSRNSGEGSEKGSQDEGDSGVFECLFLFGQPFGGQGIETSLQFELIEELIHGVEKGGVILAEGDCPFFDTERGEESARGFWVFASVLEDGELVVDESGRFTLDDLCNAGGFSIQHEQLGLRE